MIILIVALPSACGSQLIQVISLHKPQMRKIAFAFRVRNLKKITVYSYIARHQTQYLKDLKDNLTYDEVVALGDFVVNHQFFTLHPVVVYYKYEKMLISSSICITSDDFKHVSFFYQVMSETIDFIKQNMNQQISKLGYFFDGCAGQYKNKKHLPNLCHRKSDFTIECDCNFFAISHAKAQIFI